MLYELLPASQDESVLFSPQKGESSERSGAIGMMKVSFGEHGRYPAELWFDYRKHLKTDAFIKEFDRLLSFLRKDGVFTNTDNSGEYIWKQSARGLLDRNGWGMKAVTADFSYYIRCMPNVSGADTMILAYDNRYLLPELAGQHELPKKCFSVLPSSGERILIWRGQNGYDSFSSGVTDRAVIRVEVDKDNARWGVTRAQEEAMLAGSMVGWNTSAAKPWNYDQNGKPRPPHPKKEAPER